MTYGITTTVKPLFLSKQQVINLVDKEYDYENKYYYKEEETLTTLCSLLHLLNVNNVCVSQSGSKLDCHLKIDVAVKQGDRYIGFQVKSSKCGYDKYCSTYLNRRLSSQYNGYYDYNAPGCVWLNKNTDKIRFLIAISDWLSISISEETKKAIRMYKKCKQDNIKPELLHHIVSQSVINIWLTLGIAKLNNGKINYVR